VDEGALAAFDDAATAVRVGLYSSTQRGK
jgi:hypothetical protein